MPEDELEDVLRRVAAGEVPVEEAEAVIAGLRRRRPPPGSAPPTATILRPLTDALAQVAAALKASGHLAVTLDDAHELDRLPAPIAAILRSLGAEAPPRRPADGIHIDDLIRLHEAGVDADLLRAARAAGLRLQADQLVAIAGEGIDVGDLARLLGAMPSLGTDAAIALVADHVDLDLVDRYAAAGLGHLDSTQLARLLDEGVDPEMAAALFDHDGRR